MIFPDTKEIPEKSRFFFMFFQRVDTLNIKWILASLIINVDHVCQCLMCEILTIVRFCYSRGEESRTFFFIDIKKKVVPLIFASQWVPATARKCAISGNDAMPRRRLMAGTMRFTRGGLVENLQFNAAG